jgi:hypothetical protein
VAADLLVDDPGDAADQGFFDRLRQALVVGDVALGQFDEALHRVLVALGRGGGRGEDLDHAHPRQRRLLGDVLEEGGKPRLDPLLPAALDRGAALLDPAHRLVDGGVEGGEENLLLALEVVVEGLAGDPGATDDVGDLGRLVALFCGQLGDRVHDPPLLVGGDELAWQLGTGGWGGRLGCGVGAGRHRARIPAQR